VSVGYESLYELVERPFSLTPDPKYFFKSRSHGRAAETLTFGLRRHERFLLVTGELGVGKTILCKTLVEQLGRRHQVAYVASPLLAPADLLHLVLEDLGAVSQDDVQRGRTADASPPELYGLLVDYLSGLKGTRDGVVLIIDEAHNTPPPVVEQILGLSSLELDHETLLQFALVGQPAISEPSRLGIDQLDRLVTTRARILPLGRDECAAYVSHRLTIAGGTSLSFTPRAIDVLFGLSGGIPRLVNLLCERALQLASMVEAHKIEAAMIQESASALELLRVRAKRFRWFNKRVS